MISGNSTAMTDVPDDKWSYWQRQIPLWLFVFALFVRVGHWVDSSQNVTHGFTDFHWLAGAPVSDAMTWVTFADALQRGCGENHDWVARRPLYGYFLASLFSVTDAHILAAQWANVFMSSASVVLIYSISRRLFGVVAGLGTALWFCVNPYSLTLSTIPLSETMGAFFTIWHLWLLIRGTEEGRGNLVGAGLAFAAANLTRTLSLFALPMEVLLIWLICGKRDRSVLKGFRAAFVFGASASTLLILGMLRNWWLVGIFTISDNTASILYAATAPEHGAWSAYVEHEANELGLKTNKERYSYFMKKAVENLKAHPGLYISRVQKLSWVVIGESMASPWFYWPQYAYIAAFGLLGFSWIGRVRNRVSTGRMYWFAAMVAAVIAFIYLGFDIRCRYVLWALASLALLRSILRVDSGLYVANLWVFSVLGIAAFGVYDARFTLMYDWLLAIGVFGGIPILVDLFAWIAFGSQPAMKVQAEADHAVVALHRLLIAATGAVIVIGAIGIQSECHAEPECAHATEQQLQGVIQRTLTGSPEKLPSSVQLQLSKLIEMGGIARQEASKKSPLTAASHRVPGSLVVITARMEGAPCRLPAMASFKNHFKVAETRLYDRTVIRFYGCYADGKGCNGWLLMEGNIPDASLGQEFCFVAVYDQYYPGDFSDLYEGISLFPISKDNEIEFDKGYFENSREHLDLLEKLMTEERTKESTAPRKK